MYPLSCAILRGVSSKSFLAFTSAPFSIKNTTKSYFPARAAQCNGVLPPSSLSVILHPFDKNNSVSSLSGAGLSFAFLVDEAKRIDLCKGKMSSGFLKLAPFSKRYFTSSGCEF
jgi:hypothetical protein